MHAISALLDAATLAEIRRELANGEWADGGQTAGALARRAKRNEELCEHSRRTCSAQERVVDALSRSDLVTSVVLPSRFAPPLFSRYRPGMRYGNHVDNALLSGVPPLRTDVAVTVFLNDPAEYEGGELVVRTPAGEAEVKLPAGHAIVYDASMQHRVAPVRGGERLAAVTWVQSLVRDAGIREMLHDLNVVLAHHVATAPGSSETALLAKTYGNLLRRYAEP